MCVCVCVIVTVSMPRMCQCHVYILVSQHAYRSHADYNAKEVGQKVYNLHF